MSRKVKLKQARHELRFYTYCKKNLNKIIFVIFAEKGYDIEDNHVFLRNKLHGLGIIIRRYHKMNKYGRLSKCKNVMKHATRFCTS
jgi:hypothetical protein